QPDQGYCTTNHNLIDVIGPVLEQAKGKDYRILHKMAEAIRMNFSSRGRLSLVRMAIFECSLISLIGHTDPDHLGGTISPTWLARELSGLKKLEEALRQGWSLEAEEAAFLAAFTGLLKVISERPSIIW
ncbi:hypothetical protein FocTR4_00010718, partial [Fusarium oxysporum f. sp. cubense]